MNESSLIDALVANANFKNNFFDISGDKSIAHKKELEEMYYKYLLLMIVVSGNQDYLAEFKNNPIPYLTNGVNDQGQPLEFGWWSMLGNEDKGGVGMIIPTNAAIEFDPELIANSAIIYLLQPGTLDKYYDPKPKVYDDRWKARVKQTDKDVVFFIKEELTKMDITRYGNKEELNAPNNEVFLNGEKSSETGVYSNISSTVHTEADSTESYKVTVDIKDVNANEYDVIISLPLMITELGLLGEVVIPEDDEKVIMLSTT